MRFEGSKFESNNKRKFFNATMGMCSGYVMSLVANFAVEISPAMFSR